MMQYFLMSLTLGFVHLSEQEVHEHRVAGIALEQKAHFHSMGKEATEIVKDVIAGTTAGLAAKGMHDAVLPEGQESKGSYLASGAIGAGGGATAYLGEHAVRKLMPESKYWADPARRAMAGAGAAATDMFVAEHDIASAPGAAGIFAGALAQPAVGFAADKAESWWNGEKEKSDVEKAQDEVDTFKAKLAEKEKAKKDADEKLTTAQEDQEKAGDEATDKQKKAVEDAKKNVETAQEALEAAKKDLDAAENKLTTAKKAEEDAKKAEEAAKKAEEDAAKKEAEKKNTKKETQAANTENQAEGDQ